VTKKLPKTIASQREAYAEWVVQRLSNFMHREEIGPVLARAGKLARKLTKKTNAPPAGACVIEVPKRRRGRPGKWVSAFGVQMVAEVESLLEPERNEAAVIKWLMPHWRKRFPDKTDEQIRRNYRTAAKWAAERDDDE
jgi:hypothetical protein